MVLELEEDVCMTGTAPGHIPGVAGKIRVRNRSATSITTEVPLSKALQTKLLSEAA